MNIAVIQDQTVFKYDNKYYRKSLTEFDKCRKTFVLRWKKVPQRGGTMEYKQIIWKENH